MTKVTASSAGPVGTRRRRLAGAPGSAARAPFARARRPAASRAWRLRAWLFGARPEAEEHSHQAQAWNRRFTQLGPGARAALSGTRRAPGRAAHKVVLQHGRLEERPPAAHEQEAAVALRARAAPLACVRIGMGLAGSAPHTGLGYTASCIRAEEQAGPAGSRGLCLRLPRWSCQTLSM